MATDIRAQGRVLLPIARAAISTALGYPLQVAEDAPWLQAHGACFVTLTQQQRLRGCIGTLQVHRSLLQDLKSNAVAAALHDPRFLPLNVVELDHTEVEVSLLSPMQTLQFDDEAQALAQLQPGVHGVVFSYRHYRSTFLPQVWEQLPDTADFMAQLKRKAGLPANFWAAKVQLQSYTVCKWRERDAPDTAGDVAP